MAIPSEKHPELKRLLDGLIGGSRDGAIKTDRCINPPTGCGKPATEFDNELSKKEFTINGLCQACQDKFFGTEEE